ncbi:MAG: hypothetical protein HY353_01115 [Candidatus Omnitrophica bacterium]|nr:hypothetical protein [Candidatus Omnitrophota bacterium]
MSLRLRILKHLAPHSRRSRTGFTLAELSAATIASTIILGIVTHIYLATNTTIELGYGQGTLQMDLTYAADAFERDAAETYEMPLSWDTGGICPSSTGTLWRDHDSNGDGVARLILRTAGIAPTSGQSLSNMPDFFVYTFNSAKGLLQREVCTNSPMFTTRVDSLTVLARDITRVKWSWGNVNQNGTGRLEVTMQLWGVAQRGPLAQGHPLTVVSRAALRNTPP